MKTFKANLDVTTLEFLLDLPEGVAVAGAEMRGRSVVFTLSTNAEVTKPIVNLFYSMNEEGHMLLQGIE
jgi:hypothetical protein